MGEKEGEELGGEERRTGDGKGGGGRSNLRFIVCEHSLKSITSSWQ